MNVGLATNASKRLNAASVLTLQRLARCIRLNVSTSPRFNVFNASTLNDPKNMRNGKIARLPHQIREQLNQRLDDGESSETLLPWLNSLPKTQAVLAQYFGGRPIHKQNLSEWRQGGFREWQTRCQAANLLHEIQDDHHPDHQSLTKLSTAKLARWLSIQYAATAYSLSSLADDPQAQWKRLRELCVDISRLRRADLLDERLRLDRKWLALETSNSEAAKEKQFHKWLKRPDIRKN